jgi:stearoyl-CoA 9-desaturase NADPH oxidoreductase
VTSVRSLVPPVPLGSAARGLVNSRLLGALATPHGVERYAGVTLPWFSQRDSQTEIVDVRREVAGSVTLRLRASEGWWQDFRAGQHVRLTVEIGGVRETRCYSPTCGERSGGEIELTVKAHPAGKVSRYLNHHARPGMRVWCSRAEGEFLLARKRPERLLLISGGSGITPAMSLLRTLHDEGHPSQVTFLHYARNRRHIPYREELEQIAESTPNVSLELVGTREDRARARRFGRGELARVASDYRRAHTYVCGPPGLIEAVRTLWAEDGIDQPLWFESFQPVSFAVSHEEVEGSVRFARSGKRVASDGRCLLDQAEQAGLHPPFGCRMGICRMCTVRKTAGSVRNVLSGEISARPDEDIQICISAPVGDVELAV